MILQVALAGVIRQQPELPIRRVGILAGKVVPGPRQDLARAIAVPRHPELDRAVASIAAIILVPRTDLHAQLKRHPFVGPVAHRRDRLDRLVLPVLRTAAVIQLRIAALPGVLHHDFDRCAGICTYNP